MGPMDEDMPLEVVQERFPGWDVRQVFGGFLATPKGTPVVLGMFVASVADKLVQHERNTK